jgi:BMFP domain-containing protein YqiC
LINLSVSKILWQALGISSAVLGATFVLVNSAIAIEVPTKSSTFPCQESGARCDRLEQINRYTQQAKSQVTVTSVSQLSDIQPNDWEILALQSLVDRYGCISGYPVREALRKEFPTYRGERAVSRYEFAASLNTCLNKVNETIVAGTSDLVTKDDLITLQRLREEFAVELATLRGRVDNLEAQITQLEAQQFSTTTKLEGEIIFAISAAGGEDKADGSGDEVDKNPILTNRVRLDFETSFTGRDRLRTRLQARNLPSFADATGTEMARLGFEGSNDNEVELSSWDYRFPVGQQAMVYVGGDLGDFTNDINPLLGDIRGSGTGAISRFGRSNPIYRQGGSFGVGFTYEFSDAASLGFGYAPDDAEDPQEGIGGAYGAIAQLTFRPSEAFGLGLTYVRSYNSLDTGTGSERANDPFNGESDKVSANTYGVDISFQISPALTLGGWVGFTQAAAQDLPDDPEASIFNYAMTLVFPDLGKEGNVAGIVIGQPPKLTDNDYEIKGEEYEDEDTSLHLEAFYLFQATDNIAITPGVLVIINPEHDNNNDTVYVGTIRTTISF